MALINLEETMNDTVLRNDHQHNWASDATDPAKMESRGHVFAENASLGHEESCEDPGTSNITLSTGQSQSDAENEEMKLPHDMDAIVKRIIGGDGTDTTKLRYLIMLLTAQEADQVILGYLNKKLESLQINRIPSVTERNVDEARFVDRISVKDAIPSKPCPSKEHLGRNQLTKYESEMIRASLASNPFLQKKDRSLRKNKSSPCDSSYFPSSAATSYQALTPMIAIHTKNLPSASAQNEKEPAILNDGHNFDTPPGNVTQELTPVASSFVSTCFTRSNESQSPSICEAEQAIGIGVLKYVNEAMGRSENCAHCEEAFKRGNAVVEAKKGCPKKYWHPGCFRCCECGVFLQQLIYFSRDADIYCKKHFAEMPVEAGTEINETKMFPDNVDSRTKGTCIQCGLDFDTYFVMSNQKFCISCFKRIRRNAVNLKDLKHDTRKQQQSSFRQLSDDQAVILEEWKPGQCRSYTFNGFPARPSWSHQLPKIQPQNPLPHNQSPMRGKPGAALDNRVDCRISINGSTSSPLMRKDQYVNNAGSSCNMPKNFSGDLLTVSAVTSQQRRASAPLPGEDARSILTNGGSNKVYASQPAASSSRLTICLPEGTSSGSSRRESTVFGRAGMDEDRAYEVFYPYPLVMRLRVLQIVSGILSILMGMVAYLEEQGKLNLCASCPEGLVVIVAASFSVHFTRGFDGYKPVDSDATWTSRHHQSAGFASCSGAGGAASYASLVQRRMSAPTLLPPNIHRAAVAEADLSFSRMLMDKAGKMAKSRYGFVALLWVLASALTLFTISRVALTLCFAFDGKVAVVAVLQLAFSSSVAISVVIVGFIDLSFEKACIDNARMSSCK
ncbi:unnamed protein product [Notodromas monacha]|uniref:LIM zinc-binding domain-containing protein n=1 Tax=Notodromas monacha TaxID=399045 RepID=A0A7R9GFT0_9CRUS|nr:unnamed protein product [Notodromas monacha]CAG0921091.1 unnamed protein product [Notodromas monacha]